MNRQFLTALACSFFALALTAVDAVQSAEPAIIEGARKEAKLVLYASMLTENATALLTEFKKNIRSSKPHFIAPIHKSSCPRSSLKRAPSNTKRM